MILYNITFREDTSKILTPRIPYTAGDGEDKTQERVCFSDSLNRCIEAIGPCERDMHIGSTFYVRSVDTSDMNAESIITPQELFDRELVPDALEIHEYWYLKEIPVKLNKAKVINFSFEFDLAWTCIRLQDLQQIVSKLGVSGINTVSSKQLYEKVNHYFNEHKMYDQMDALCDSIVELPYAQKLKVNDLELRLYS